jgi:membrane protease YdiL (CAAX protease family)
MPDSPLSVSGQPAPVTFFRNPGIPFVFVRLCVYLILGEGAIYVLRPVLRRFAQSGLPQTSPQVIFLVEFLALLGAFFAAFVLSLLERRGIGEYGLRIQRNSARQFLQGAVFGIAEISAVLAVLAALGCYRFGSLELHGKAIVSWALVWAVVFVIVGLYEEFAFRGYVQFTLAQAIGFWPAAVALSLLFGAVHWANPGETPAGIVGVVLSGLFWCFTLHRTGTLWFAVGMHASFDFAETFLYSVPDSGAIFPGHLSSATLVGPAWLTGGSAGPEASIVDFLAIGALFYVFHRLFPRISQPSSVPPQAQFGQTHPSVDQV